MGKLFPGSYGSVCSLSLQGVERMCIDPKTMQPTGGKCCGEPKMRLPGCPLCDDDGCCPEHCCDWDTCECECSSGREKYCQPSLDDPAHAPPSIEELIALEQSLYGGAKIEAQVTPNLHTYSSFSAYQPYSPSLLRRTHSRTVSVTRSLLLPSSSCLAVSL